MDERRFSHCDSPCRHARAQYVAFRTAVSEFQSPIVADTSTSTMHEWLRGAIMLAIMERMDTRGTQRPQPREVLDLLEQFGSTISVQHDREIHGEGDTAEFCYRVVAGCVRIVKLMEDGRRQICEFLMAGDLLGFDALDCYD